MRRLIKCVTLLLAFCFILCGSLVGCAKEGEKTEDGKTIIKLGVSAESSEVTIATKFKLGYEAQNDSVSVQIVRFDKGRYNEELLGFVSAGNMPDLIWTGGDLHAPYSYNGIFENLKPYMDRDGINVNDYVTSMWDAAKLDPNKDTEYFFAPRDYNKIVVICNKAMFDEVGIEIPKEAWTWEEFMDICETFRTAMNNEVNPEIGLSEMSYPLDMDLAVLSHYYAVIKGFGGDIIDEEGNLVLDKAENIPALQAIKDIVDKGYGMAPSEKTGSLFNSRRAAMSLTVRPVVSTLVSINNLEIDFAPFPLMPINYDKEKGSYLPDNAAGCSGYAMSASSKNKELAWGLLKYILSEEGQNAFGVTGDSVPVLKKLLTDPNAAWRQYQKEKNWNNDVFYQDQERDLFLNYGWRYAENQVELQASISGMIVNLCEQNFGGYVRPESDVSIKGLTNYYMYEISQAGYLK